MRSICVCFHAEVVADLTVYWLSLVVLTKKEKKKDYCNLEGSQWEDCLVVETSTDHAAFIYLVVAGLVLVWLGREEGMAGVTLHVSFFKLVRTISNILLFYSDKAEGNCGGIVKRTETGDFILLFLWTYFFPCFRDLRHKKWISVSQFTSQQNDGYNT